MARYQLQPYVAGGLGEATVFDRSVTPPRILALHYEFDDWAGDAIVESTPCFLVMEDVGESFSKAKLTGFELRDARVSVTDVYRQLHGDPNLPKFKWLYVTNSSRADDFALDDVGNLVVSEQAMAHLRNRLPNCGIKKLKM